MKLPGYPGKRLLMVLLVALVSLAGACGDDDGDDPPDDDNGAEVTLDDNDGPDISDDAPDPMPIDIDDIEYIDEWQEAGVPRFRDGEVLDFEPHASQVENGGTILLDGLNESPEEIIGFYRGALQALGWQEGRASDVELTAQNEVASLLVRVSVYEDQTLIMMILTDSLRSG